MAGAARMTLIAFLQAQNCSNLPASWRHPAAGDFMAAEYDRRIGRTLEEGRFHLAFFDHRLAMPDVYSDDFKATVREGIRTVTLDPMLCATALPADRGWAA